MKREITLKLRTAPNPLKKRARQCDDDNLLLRIGLLPLRQTVGLFIAPLIQQLRGTYFKILH
jgi:hypothetical protein